MSDNKLDTPKRHSYLPHAQKALIKKQEIARVQSDCMAFYRLGATKVKSDKELVERLEQFFDMCINLETPVTVEKMCLSLGYAVSSIWDIETGRRKGFSPETAEIIKKAKSFIQTCDADLAINGNMDRVVYLFRAKNYYGMKDQQDVVVTPNNPLGEVQDVDEIAKRVNADTANVIDIDD